MLHRTNSLFLLAMIASSLYSCDTSNLGEALPIMGINQQKLEFGAVAVGDTHVRKVLIQNTGTGRLHLTATIEQDEASAFSVSNIDDRIDAGFQGSVEVSFHPPDVERFTAILSIKSNDKTNPMVQVQLGGDGWRRGAIQVTPSVVDFGKVNAGDVGLGQVFIKNVGNGDLTITAIELVPGTNPDFKIQSSSATPAIIAQGDQAVLLLAYRPAIHSVPPDEGTLLIKAADPYQPETQVRLLAELNRAPVADAGDDQQTDPLVQVMLDASASTDPDGDLPLSYSWSLARKPEGSSAQLVSIDMPQTSFTPDLVGVYEAELYVTDSTGLRSLLPDRATITALPSERLLVELVWDSPIADLDLHFIAPGGTIGGFLDCHWANPQPDWGIPGDPSDDPQLIRDDLAGFGPETLGYQEPMDGEYSVMVNYFASHTPSGKENTKATLRVFVDGFLVAEISHDFTQQLQTWHAANITWPEGTVDVQAGSN